MGNKASGGEHDDVYTMAEAARLKGVSYHTVSRAVRAGALAHRRIGRMAFVAAADLAAWRPMVQRAPKAYRRREPDPAAAPAMLDLAAGDRVALAERYAILAESLHVAALERPLADVLALLCDRFVVTLDLTRVTIWGVDRDCATLLPLARWGEPMGDLSDIGPFADILASRRATVRDVAAFGPPPPPLPGVGPLFAAPLRAGDRALGLVLGDRGGNPFALDDDQLAFAQALATQVAVAVELAQLRAQVAALSVLLPQAADRGSGAAVPTAGGRQPNVTAD